MEELKRLVGLGGGVRKALARSAAGEECRMIYGDLCGAEDVLMEDGNEIDDGELLYLWNLYIGHLAVSTAAA